MVRLVHRRTVNKHGYETIKVAVMAALHLSELDLIRQYTEMIDIVEGADKGMPGSPDGTLPGEHCPTKYERLQTLPGVKERAATAIIAVSGAAMEHFENRNALWNSAD